MKARGAACKIPENATIEQIDGLGLEVSRAIEEVGTRLETIGYMVYCRIATLEMVNDLIRGVVIFWWARIRPFVERDREKTANPKSYEWTQWLAERLRERRERFGAVPAYERHVNWR